MVPMRWSLFGSAGLVVLAGALWIGCSGSQDDAVQQPTPEPPPPTPTAQPRVWDAESSYRVGWPITIRAGIINVGETVVNAPRGEYFGLSVNAWRVEQVEVPAEPAAPAAADAGAAGDGGAAQADGGPAAPAEPRMEERREALDCDSVGAETPHGGVFPLATSSSTNRTFHIDRLCNLDRPGRYVLEVVVDVPTIEGADVSGPQAPVNVEFELTLPDPPVVARLDLEQESYELGSPLSASVRVTNFGAEPLRISNASHLRVELSAQARGEAVPCAEAPTPRGRPSAGNLPPGDHRDTTVNIGERCQLTIPGSYTITPRVVVPAAGRGTFSGTLEAAPLHVEIVQPEATEEPTEDLPEDSEGTDDTDE